MTSCYVGRLALWRTTLIGAPSSDPSLVSVVLLPGNQDHFGRDLRKRVRQSTRKSASVRGSCRSVSHSAFIWVVPSCEESFDV